MFPKLLKNATVEDVKQQNPALLAAITADVTSSLSESLSATLQTTHKEALAALEAKHTETETLLATVSSNYNILSAGAKAKQADLAMQLIAEGKPETEALAAITAAQASLASFTASAPAPAGAGSQTDADDISTQTQAVETIAKKHPEASRASHIKMARRAYPELFVSPHLINHNEKR